MYYRHVPIIDVYIPMNCNGKIWNYYYVLTGNRFRHETVKLLTWVAVHIQKYRLRK